MTDMPPKALAAWLFYARMNVSFVNAGHALLLPSLVDALHLGPAAAGLLLSCAFWGMAASIFAFGPLADRFGFRRPFLAGTVLGITGLLLIGVSASRLQVYLGVLTASAAVGAWHVLPSPLACALFPQSRTRMLLLLDGGCSVGAVVMALLVMGLLHRALPWSGMYLLLAALAAPLLLTPCLMGLGTAFVRRGFDRRQVAALFRLPLLYALLAGTFLIAVTAGVGTWAPTYLEKAVGATPFIGALSIVLSASAGALAQLGGAGLAARIGRQPILLLAATLTCLALLVIAAAHAPLAVLCGFVLLSLGSGVIAPVALAGASERFAGAGSSVFSLAYGVGNVGMAAGPSIIGLGTQEWSARGTFGLLAVVPVVVILLFRPLLLPARSQSR